MSVAHDTPPPSAAHERPPVSVRSLFDAGPPAMVAKCIAAIRRDLPEMLESHRGWWVAYHGDDRIGFARTKTQLYQECLRRGLAPDQFLVCGVEEGAYDPDAEVEATLDA